jgi:hypothetical protein
VEHAHEHAPAVAAPTTASRTATQADGGMVSALPLAGLLRDDPAVRSVARRSPAVIRRAVLAPLAKEPTYKDGLTLDTIIKTAVDKPVKPQKAKDVKKLKKKKFGADETAWPADASVFLNDGEVHGNQVYENKDHQLPAGSYKEYDIAKFTSGVGRGTDRVVVGEATASPGVTKYYFTGDHYQNFSPFTPGASAPVTPAPVPVATGTPVATAKV